MIDRIKGNAVSPKDPSYPRLIAQRYAQEFPSVGQDTVEAGLRVTSALMAMSGALVRLIASTGMSVTPARYQVLRILHFADGGQRAQIDIGNELGVTRANVTFLIDGLEAEGLVARVPHPADRRVTLVELTGKGRDTSAMLVEAVAGFFQHLFLGFSHEEAQVLCGLLERLHRNADNSYQD